VNRRLRRTSAAGGAGAAADHDVDSKLDAPEVCLWLDGLDRFFDALGKT
jgi:hypothetical protein